MMTILIVDDDPELLDLLKRALRREPWQVLTTTSPYEALDCIAEGGIDVLISDVDMPDMTGHELVRKVRDEHPQVARLLLTGTVSLESAMKAINDGEVLRYLTKPWKNDELVETLRHVMGRLEELKRANAAAHTASLRERIRIELEREHPGITMVERHDGVYLLDVERIDQVTATISLPAVRAFLKDG